MNPKMVEAFVWVVRYKSGTVGVDIASTKAQAEYARATRYPYDVVGPVTFGPITRIEAEEPLTEERKYHAPR